MVPRSRRPRLCRRRQRERTRRRQHLVRLREGRAAARTAAWAAGAAPDLATELCLDFDATIVIAHSDKGLAAPTWKRSGFIPLSVTSIGPRSPPVKPWRDRPGRPGRVEHDRRSHHGVGHGDRQPPRTCPAPPRRRSKGGRPRTVARRPPPNAPVGRSSSRAPLQSKLKSSYLYFLSLY